MWNTVEAIVIAYGVIRVAEYIIKSLLTARQAQVTLSPEMQRIIQERLAQYNEDVASAYGRSIPKRQNIGFTA